MSKKNNKILIVDDDKDILFSLSKVLELEGYIAQTAPSGTLAIEKAKNEVFDVFLLDIKLPDMEGTELLTQLQSITPDATKIMITGYPSVDNAIKSLNMGANSFFTKPVSLDALLRDIKDKLKERDRKKIIAGKKVEEWVKLRISKIQLSEYSRFAEEAADLFNIFGLSRTQAKIYTALNALGVATASEIAALSKIRREEIYRVMPELESRGMIISKLDAPRKFAATEPKTALKILVNSKVDSMEREINTLKQKKDDLIARLENTSFGIYEENSVEALSRQDNIEMRLSQMTKKAKNQIVMVGSLEEMKKIIQSSSEATGNQIRMRTVVDSSDIKDLGGRASLRRFLQVSCKGNCSLDLRQVDRQAFNLLVVDSKEAIWGEPSSKKTEGKVFWTNDPTQVGILRRAFENLWQEALPCESLENGVKESTLM
jgi:YesN/AraC family two-component response regulator